MRCFTIVLKLVNDNFYVLYYIIVYLLVNIRKNLHIIRLSFLVETKIQ